MTNDSNEFGARNPEDIEIRVLTDTILEAFELAESIETHAITPGAQEIQRSIAPEMIDREYLATLLPDEVLAQVDIDNIGLTITYQFTSPDVRPSLELNFFVDTNEKEFYFATIQRRSGEAGIGIDFSGNALVNPSARDYGFAVSNDAVSQFIQDLIKIDNLIVDDEGVRTVDTDPVLDPQYPPMTRYIHEVLAMQGLASKDDTSYPMEFDGKKFIVSTTMEDGKTTTVTIVEVLLDEISAFGDDIRHSYSSIGAKVSRTKLSQAVEFFKLSEQGVELPIDGSSVDLFLLRERIAYLAQRINQELL